MISAKEARQRTDIVGKTDEKILKRDEKCRKYVENQIEKAIKENRYCFYIDDTDFFSKSLTDHVREELINSGYSVESWMGKISFGDRISWGNA